MTQLTNEDIKKFAKLACIELDEASHKILIEQVGSTINWITQIKDAETDNIEPLINVHDQNLRLTPDVIDNNNSVDDILRNTGNAKYNYFSVPKVIE